MLGTVNGPSRPKLVGIEDFPKLSPLLPSLMLVAAPCKLGELSCART